ncbi:MAG: TIGR04282 family arsenosugar biosynthesis glycosyltransferase [Chloroflexota bacterium]
MTQRALLVIAKRPQAGRTKTRLTPPLSGEQAAQLYECFLKDTLDIARRVPNITRFVLYAPENEATYFEQLAPDFNYLYQTGSDLGERLDNALTHCLSHGYQQVVVMNSDGPTLPANYLTQAFAQLEQSEAVFGPSEDGGYYLVGLTRPQPRLLREVKMSTPTVLADTLALADEEGVAVSLLQPWYDIDTINDLQRMMDELQINGQNQAQHTQTFFNQHTDLINRSLNSNGGTHV